MFMSSVELDVPALVDILRGEGSDVADIEAERAAGGYPENLPPTLSAFGNLPGGGVILLGLDGYDDFAATGVYDAVDAQQRLAAQARTAVQPPLQVAFETATVDGQSVVVARVSELPAAQKPCIVTAGGRAYLRSYDGDYPLSDQEHAAFVAERGTPRYDRDVVPGATVADLDPPLLTAYLATVRARSARLGALGDEDVLRHTRVLAPGGELTLAGLYALGAYPQQFVPTLSLSARVAAMRGDPAGTRSSDLAHFDGPLPELLDQALAWVRRNTATRVRFGADGHGRDEPAYPVEAVRELVANALVHRDLGPHALGERVHLVLEADRLVLVNPGGLFGLTVEQLGHRVGGSARNQSLYDIVKDVRTVDGRRVIEGVGTGIVAARQALHAAGMTPPHFLDSGVRFTALVPQHALLNPDDLSWLAALPRTAGLSDAQRHALVALRNGEQWTNRTFRERFPMDSTQARAALVDLVARGFAVAHGERGGRIYRLAAPDEQPPGSEHRPGEQSPEPTTTSTPTGQQSRTRHGAVILSSLARGPATTAELVEQTGLTRRQVSYALRHLTNAGLVRSDGGQGVPGTTYAVT